jgi:hypothetical protein
LKVVASGFKTVEKTDPVLIPLERLSAGILTLAIRTVSGLVDFQRVMAAPRLGFAWDIFADGNTAVRGGFGVNYNPWNGSGISGDLQSNPPIVYQPQQLYGSCSVGI